MKRPSSSRKGITPIIATVLLLGITVAIGLTVYTQAQGMIGNTDTSSIDRVENTEIKLGPAYNDGGHMQLKVTNKGERAINTTQYTIYYGPPNWDPVSYSTIIDQTSWNYSIVKECFTPSLGGGGGKLLEPGESMTCGTGVQYPGALESVEMEVRAKNFDYTTSYTCEVESEGQKSC